MTRYAPQSGLMYDGFPGSTYVYYPDEDALGGGNGHWLLGGYGYSVDMYDGQFMFIPTASALCFVKGSLCFLMVTIINRSMLILPNRLWKCRFMGH